MKLFLLMVLFSTPGNPEPHEEYGFGSRRVESMEVCLQRRDYLETYLAEYAPPSYKFTAFCVEFRALGYDEALEEFKSSIGRPL